MGVVSNFTMSYNGSVLVMQSFPSLVCAKLDRKTEAKFLP